MEKGKQQLILKMLHRNISIQTVAKMTGLSEEEIKQMESHSKKIK